MKRYFIALVSLLCAAFPAAAQDAAAEDSAVQTAGTEQPADGTAAPAESGELSDDAMWDKANTFYVNGDYRSAAETYEAILGRGRHSAKLYYNLGNACFKSGETGRAILFYRRALRLAPGSDDIRYNLSVAEESTKDSIESVPEFFLATWMRTLRNIMSTQAWTGVSLVALVAMLSLAMLYLLASRLSLRKTGFYGMLAALLLFVAATVSAASGRREALDRSEAVVMGSSVPVKSSPDKAATDLFVLHEGTVLRITDRLDDWCEIVIADGKKGWIRSQQIEIV